MSGLYRTGTVSVTAGSATVTGTLTAFTQAVKEGDLLIIGNNFGVVSATPTAETSLTLAEPWSGPSATNSSYVIALFSPRHSWPTDVLDYVRRALTAAKSITSGTAVPSAGEGVLNDIYFRTLPGGGSEMYIRGDAAWSAPISQQGPPGVSGSETRSLVINGDFTINQRAFAGGSLANGAYGYDRWKASGTTSVTLTSVTTGIVSLTGAIEQTIEPRQWGLASFAGVPVTVSVDTPSGALSVFLGSQGGTISAGSGRRSVTITPNQDGSLALWISTLAGATVTFARVKAEVGSQATGWTPRNASDELRLAQRYYWRRNINGADYNVLCMLQAFAANNAWGGPIPTPVEMRVAPTMSVSSAAHFSVYGPQTGTKVCSSIQFLGVRDAVWVYGSTFSPASTVGAVEMLYFSNGTAGWFAASAEF